MTRLLTAVGHGRRPNGTLDQGAHAGDATEQSEGDPIARAMVDVLERAGVTVKLIGAGGPNWQGAADEANRWGADYAIEIHHDWSGAPRGAFGHWHSSSREGRQLADAILNRLRSDLDYPVRSGWHRSRDELGWVRSTRMPAVLWECDRIGEVTDHQAYGRALARGVLDHLDLPDPDDPDPEDWFAMATKAELRDVLDEWTDTVADRAAELAVRRLLGYARDGERDVMSLIASGGLRFDELDDPHPHDQPRVLEDIRAAVED